eukprot:gb/GEZJ01002998.1/.p1 GENE.gb/GEZJ01002998.1/~~gb/GEZJ01002998.1/.p1  ORF type:complete len:469 (+),score=70.78 gb/GEZJ01002998.1/:1025-2431(+)
MQVSDYFEGSNLNATKVAGDLVSLFQTTVDHDSALNNMFVLFSGYLVFLMQCGFAMLTAGSIRSKNVKNVLIKNILDACVGALAYYLFGWAFAYGPGGSAQGFIGAGQFALSSYDGAAFEDFTGWFFQWAFAATAATIVSGSVAERTSFYAYIGYAFFLTAFVYPVVSHWVWGGGFLSSFLGNGMIDFAGCSVVHMVGGFAGLFGAIIVGPRIGRFDSSGKPVPLPGHSATLATLGTFLLWFGWYGFNPGSALGITGGLFATVQRCAVTTTIAGATGGVVTLIIKKVTEHNFDLISVLNGILAGLVAITASCAFVDVWAAVIIGAIGAGVYITAATVLIMLKIDDPLEAFPIHGATGFWGCIAAGFFNRKAAQEVAGFDNGSAGVIDGYGKLLLANFVGCLIIIAWVAVLLIPFFLVLNLLGLFRIPEYVETEGNDLSKHGGPAYPELAIPEAEKEALKEIQEAAEEV